MAAIFLLFSSIVLIYWFIFLARRLLFLCGIQFVLNSIYPLDRFGLVKLVVYVL